MDDPLKDYSDDDILNDYLLMADTFNQDDPDVKEYREELERRGYTFVTEEPEPNEEDDYYTYWGHPSLTVGERNPSLARRTTWR